MASFQNDGLSENEHQLSVAGKIKKHFNTGPKPSNNTPGVSVMTVSPHGLSKPEIKNQTLNKHLEPVSTRHHVRWTAFMGGKHYNTLK